MFRGSLNFTGKSMMPSSSRQMLIRTLLLLVILLLIGSFFAFDLGRYLTLELLQSQRQELQDLYSNDPLTIVAAYVAIYILVAGLSLPGAVIMTLAGGATFGLGVGTIAVSLGSTVGATVAFWRHVFYCGTPFSSVSRTNWQPLIRGLRGRAGFISSPYA